MYSAKSKLVEKPWGYEIIWAMADKYVGKILHINSGHSLSRQYHKVKEETIRVLSGSMNLEISNADNTQVQVFNLKSGDVFHISPQTIHRMVALEDTDVVEVSTPELDDVVRLEDKYGRA